jgi:hypothetical protein
MVAQIAAPAQVWCARATGPCDSSRRLFFMFHIMAAHQLLLAAGPLGILAAAAAFAFMRN